MVGRLLLAICILVLLSVQAATALADDERVVLKVPYRSQFDGSYYEGANCGPTTVGMVLEAFGKSVSTAELRKLANELQGSDVYDGVWIYNLAAMAERYGMRTSGLYAGEAFHKWTAAEVREQIRLGHVVVPEVRFRFLPGHMGADTWDDHYIVIFGVVGDSFVYHDSASRDGSGAYRTIGESTLVTAMMRSEFPYTAFAVAAPPPPSPAPVAVAPGHGGAQAPEASPPPALASEPRLDPPTEQEGYSIAAASVDGPERLGSHPTLVLVGLFSLFTLGAAASRRW